jgi:DNA invertase Pin-like site-specific DNA recombinase
MMKAAIYVRVSTNDKGQDTENQALGLRECCAEKQWKVVDEYPDYMTGKTLERPQFQRMLEDAKKRKFDVLVFWSLDRLTRRGALDALKILEQLTASKVAFLSLREPYLDTSGPMGEMMVAIIACLAKQERLRLSERTKAGMERARLTGTKSGKKFGRPTVGVTAQQVQELRNGPNPLSYSQIGNYFGISKSSAKRLCETNGKPEAS